MRRPSSPWCCPSPAAASACAWRLACPPSWEVQWTSSVATPSAGGGYTGTCWPVTGGCPSFLVLLPAFGGQELDDVSSVRLLVAAGEHGAADTRTRGVSPRPLVRLTV